MGNIVDFTQFFGQPDVGEMDRGELLTYLEHIKKQIVELDEEESADMMSEEYEAWGDRREELEDLADEILDRLDDLG